jgi:hypothetical protein
MQCKFAVNLHRVLLLEHRSLSTPTHCDMSHHGTPHSATCPARRRLPRQIFTIISKKAGWAVLAHLLHHEQGLRGSEGIAASIIIIDGSPI